MGLNMNFNANAYAMMKMCELFLDSTIRRNKIMIKNELSEFDLLTIKECCESLKNISNKLALNRMVKTQEKIDDIRKKLNSIASNCLGKS